MLTELFISRKTISSSPPPAEKTLQTLPGPGVYGEGSSFKGKTYRLRKRNQSRRERREFREMEGATSSSSHALWEGDPVVDASIKDGEAERMLEEAMV